MGLGVGVCACELHSFSNETEDGACRRLRKSVCSVPPAEYAMKHLNNDHDLLKGIHQICYGSMVRVVCGWWRGLSALELHSSHHAIVRNTVRFPGSAICVCLSGSRYHAQEANSPFQRFRPKRWFVAEKLCISRCCHRSTMC